MAILQSLQLLFFILMMAVLFAVIIFGAKSAKARTHRSPREHDDAAGAAVADFGFEAVSEFLSPAERSFFGVLRQVIGSEYHIFAKVRLADVVRPAPNPSRSGWQSAFNKITGKHVDFVLCDTSSLSVVAAVELDDRSHKVLERGIRDSIVDRALEDACIPVLRFEAKQSYAPAQIREKVQALRK